MSHPSEDGRDNVAARKKQQQQQQQHLLQPQQQQPHSPRDRRRRGPSSPLTVILLNPPSLEEATSNDSSITRGVDSLSLALAELSGGGGRPGPANFFEAHERVERAATDGPGASGGCGSEASNGGSGHDELLLNVRPLAKRSSSLKSKKTPPGTPSLVKKAVRFADAFGLDLANVKHVLDPDSPPVIPPQATSDLELGDTTESEDDDATGATEDSPSAAIGGDSQQQRSILLRPTFSQPGHSVGFGARVMAQKVVLETAYFSPATGEIRGYIRVANLAFEKSVTLRVTFDAWLSSVEVAAEYVPDSSSGMTDQFTFCLGLPASVSAVGPVSCRMAFCIAYRTCGQTFWDNNFGENYAFDAAFSGWARRV